jgi:hypothetical protein
VANHSFVILIATPGGRELTDAETEALYEAGLDDAGIETGPLYTLADFDREAPSAGEAVESACADIRKVPGLEPVLLIERPASIRPLGKHVPSRM